jgi:hypothetical protein
VRGSEPRPRAPVPIPRQARLQDAPLVDRDERKIKLPESMWIRNPGKFFALKLLRNFI